VARPASCLAVALFVAASTQPGSAQIPTDASRTSAPSLPGANPAALATIRGNAVDSAGAAMPDTLMRLRDARVGRIVDSAVTDSSGWFGFRPVDPGSYVVELMGDPSRVLASSQLLYVEAGQIISVVVQLPYGKAPFGGLLGQSVPSALAVTAAAATAGVLAATVSGEPDTP
jgi:hypothetical protein